MRTGLRRAAAVAVLAAALAGCTAAPPPPTAPRGLADAEDRRDRESVIRVAFAGDSLTAGCMQVLEEGADPCSWTGAADAAPGVHVVGGWAEWGAPASRIAEEIEPVDAEVLVILAGSNDAMIGIPLEEELVALDAIVATVGAADVLLIALPPVDSLARDGDVVFRNAALEQRAENRGWAWLDPWRGFVERDPYVWRPGITNDGIHPGEGTQAAVGQRIADAVLELVAEESGEPEGP